VGVSLQSSLLRYSLRSPLPSIATAWFLTSGVCFLYKRYNKIKAPNPNSKNENLNSVLQYQGFLPLLVLTRNPLLATGVQGKQSSAAATVYLSRSYLRLKYSLRLLNSN
jgi:hypothetical protein